MCGTYLWPELGGFSLTPNPIAGIQTWPQAPALPGPSQGVLRVLRNGVSPLPRVQSGKASSGQSPHICVCGRPSGAVMGLLEIRTCLQPRPPGPGPNHTVTCTALCVQESFLSPLVLHNALPSLGPLASFPPGRKGLLVPCHWLQAG